MSGKFIERKKKPALIPEKERLAILEQIKADLEIAREALMRASGRALRVEDDPLLHYAGESLKGVKICDQMLWKITPPPWAPEAKK